MQRLRPSRRAATVLVLVLWLPYALLNGFYPGPGPTYAVGLTLALASLAVLWLSGAASPREALWAGSALPWPNRNGICSVCVAAAAALAVWALAGTPAHWRWTDLLLFAPASALAQELYFRGALQSALVALCRQRVALAIGLQAVLFSLWHARALRVVPLGPALLVLGATFAVGLVWGWQARRDRTLLYVAAQHTVFLALV